MTRWNDKLNKKERKHLKENGITTKARFMEQIAYTASRKKTDTFFCWECYDIANKIGMWPEE